MLEVICTFRLICAGRCLHRLQRLPLLLTIYIRSDGILNELLAYIKEYDGMDISSITGYSAFWKVLFLYCEAHVFIFVFLEFEIFFKTISHLYFMYAQTYNMHYSGREQQLLSTCCHINMAMANCWLCYIKFSMTQHRDKRCWVARGSHPRFYSNSNSFLLTLLVRQHVLPMYKNMKLVYTKRVAKQYIVSYTHMHTHTICAHLLLIVHFKCR